MKTNHHRTKLQKVGEILDLKLLKRDLKLTTPHHARVQFWGVPGAGARVQKHSLTRIQARHAGLHTLDTLVTYPMG